jgi:hypothetical protein
MACAMPSTRASPTPAVNSATSNVFGILQAPQLLLVGLVFAEVLMTTPLFQYDELTWPEVAALPRQTPLILPLGSGQDLDNVPTMLQTIQLIGLLPGIPFGWAGSMLEVRLQVFSALLHNLVGNLLEDGFTSVHVLAPAGLDFSGIHQVVASVTISFPVFQKEEINTGFLHRDYFKRRTWVHHPCGL